MRRILPLAFAILASCGPPGPVDAGDGATGACGSGPGQIEVGYGGSRLRALPPTGGELAIVRGAQGGIHVLVGAWVEDMDLELELRYRLEDAADGSPVGVETVLRLTPPLFSPDGSRYVRHPDLVILDNEMPRVEDYVGRTVLLQAEAISVDGSHACDVREVTLVE